MKISTITYICLLFFVAHGSPQEHLNHFGQKIEDKIGQPSIDHQVVIQNQPQGINIPPSPVPSRVRVPSKSDNGFNENEECRSGFSVRKSLRSTLKSKTQIKFQDILTNAGGWDSTTHSFIASCPGIYFFTFNALSEEGHGFTLALMKNDKFQVTAYGGKEGYQWGANSAMLFLNRDDQVYLELQDGELYEHPFNEAYTTFTGFLVNKF